MAGTPIDHSWHSEMNTKASINETELILNLIFILLCLSWKYVRVSYSCDDAEQNYFIKKLIQLSTVGKTTPFVQ